MENEAVHVDQARLMCALYDNNHLLKDPLKCPKCNAQFCTECGSNQCPRCKNKETNTFEKLDVFKKIISESMPTLKCEYCQSSYGNQTEEQHKNICPNVRYICSFCNKYWTDQEHKFWTHITEAHKNDFVKQFDVGPK